MLDTHGMLSHQVLMALYEGAKAQGMGFLHYDSNPMSEDEAIGLVAQSDYFDYLKGRVMKISLTRLDPRLYDRDNGEGAAQQAIDSFYARLAG